MLLPSLLGSLQFDFAWAQIFIKLLHDYSLTGWKKKKIVGNL